MPFAIDQGPGVPRPLRCLRERFAERGQSQGVLEIEALRVGSCIAVESRGQRDARMGNPLACRIDDCNGVFHEHVDGIALVHETVDERTVRAVLEQAPHQVGQ